MEAAAGAPRLGGSVLPPEQSGPEMVRTLLDTAAQSGLTVVRAWWVGRRHLPKEPGCCTCRH